MSTHERDQLIMEKLGNNKKIYCVNTDSYINIRSVGSNCK